MRYLGRMKERGYERCGCEKELFVLYMGFSLGDVFRDGHYNSERTATQRTM